MGSWLPEGQAGRPATVFLSVLAHESLTRTTPTGRHVPGLAEGWSLSDDGRVLTIDLRPDVLFHDGSALTPQLVKASLDRSRQDPVQLSMQPLLREIEAIETTESGIVIRLFEPSALFLDDLEVSILKRSASGEPIGTGPFIPLDRSDDIATFVSNPAYHLGEPAIDRVELRTYVTLRTAWAALLRGDVDALLDVPNEMREFLDAESRIRTYSFTDAFSYLLAFNVHHPAFVDKRVRVAIDHAIDRQATIDWALAGAGRVSSGLWPLHWATREPEHRPRFDPRLADRLLTESGYPPADDEGPAVEAPGDRMPSRLRFTCLIAAEIDVLEPLAVIVQRQLFDVGIDMQIEAVAIGEFPGRIRRREYEAALLPLNLGPGLVRPYIAWHSSNEDSFFAFGYEGADEALESLRSAKSEDAFARAAQALRSAFAGDPPAVFLAWSELTRGVSARFDVPSAPDQDIMQTLGQWRPVDPGEP